MIGVVRRKCALGVALLHWSRRRSVALGREARGYGRGGSGQRLATDGRRCNGRARRRLGAKRRRRRRSDADE